MQTRHKQQQNKHKNSKRNISLFKNAQHEVPQARTRNANKHSPHAQNSTTNTEEREHKQAPSTTTRNKHAARTSKHRARQ